MKVAIQCDSPLLQRSLELFLEGHLSSRRQCDIIIRDKAIIDDEYPTLYISSDATADLVKPFSKAQLFEALHLSLQKAQGLGSSAIEEDITEKLGDNRVGFEILEHHIEKLTREYQANILKAVRAFYEK
ncbi:hypothetical protein [Sulfuricurvum sp.]|uniref:hypothetical protein n=1 Tax=Sulfuricurvum sp. TaxID=2025608 RepID=UPI00261A1112|nr:hypothetical protein [Sulfuricurvum sp.]MDD4950604.1 hypothetical protein [Sulfuricurvum sp.]